MLVIEKVSHQFGPNQVLNNVSLQSVGGEVTCLIGRSGCGKTTLLRLLAGLLRVQTGRILLDGDVFASQRKMLSPEERPVGMVFQEGALFPHMSVADNVAFGLPKRGARKLAKEWLKRVGWLIVLIGIQTACPGATSARCAGSSYGARTKSPAV